MVFYNSHYFRQQEFEIGESNLHIKVKGLLDSIEYDLPYDHILTSRIVEVSASGSAFATSFFSFIITLIMLTTDNGLTILFFGFISIVTFLFGIFSRVRRVVIPTHNKTNITIYFNRRNKEEVIAFADEIIASVKVYLRNKYSKFDRNMPLEPQFDNLTFLRDREIIDEKEYETFKAYLLGKEKPSIGFGN